MKRSLLALTLGVLICSKSFADGGIDGGGGGTLPADPITVSDVKRIIRDSKNTLALVFNKMSWGAEIVPDSKPISSKLFRGPKDIRVILDETDLDIREDKPCYTSDNRPVDGSIYASRPNAICISAFTIAPKLIEERARTEILALIAHELAHLLGATEDEAKDFQQDVAFQLKRMPASSVRTYLMNYYGAIDVFTNEIQSIHSKVDQIADDQMIIQSVFLGGKFSNVIMALYDHQTEIYPFNAREDQHFDYQRVRLENALTYMRALSSGTPNGQKAAELYRKVFGEVAQVTALEFATQTGSASGMTQGNRFRNYPISKISSREALKVELASLKKYFFEEEEIARVYFENHPNIPQFARPWTASPNPWLQFIGEFEVLSSTCKNEGSYARIGFKIYFDEDGRLTFKEIHANGWGNQPLEPGSQGSHGLLKIEGGSNHAIQIQEQGSYWEDYYLNKRVMTRTSVGASLEISRHEKTGMHNSAAGAKYHSSTCIFDLKKK